MLQPVLTDHQKTWFGNRSCMDCNSQNLPRVGINTRFLPPCPSCGGRGDVAWAAMAWEPWSEVIHNLWVGGVDYVSRPVHGGDYHILTGAPGNLFDLVVSAYNRPGFEPTSGEHLVFPLDDAALTSEALNTSARAARAVVQALRGDQRVLVRCQAGINRSSFIAGLAMVSIGYSGLDAVQVIRSRRSPWALCNQDYADYLSNMSAGESSVPCIKNEGEQ